MNYCDYLFQTGSAWLPNLALVDAGSGRSWSYAELQEAVLNLAGSLHRAGVRPGEVVATHLYNGAEAVLAHLAIQYLGGVSCLLDPLVTAEGLAWYLEDCGAAALCTHLPPEKLVDPPAKVRHIFTADGIAAMADDPSYSSQAGYSYKYEPDQLAAIFYTSGTTSRPKGVMLTPRNFDTHFRIFCRAVYTYETDDRLLCFVPFSHGYGSKSVFIPCLHAGAALVIMRSFQPYKVAEAIGKYRITHLFGVPAHFQQLLRKEELVAPLRRLKAAFSAAALLKIETAREWHEKVGFHLDEGYGLIETCTGVSFRRGSLPDRMGHIGTYPPELVTVEIADEAMNMLPCGERGEIVVRGSSVMLGYLNRPEESARALQNGWFRTGDMGYKTAENQLIMTGRIKDVINIAGIKVAPFEIEAALNEHPAVVESAVIGIEDEAYGEVVKAFVKKRADAVLDERDLKLYLQKKLMNFQVPKVISFIEEFPRNNMGKIDKNALQRP
jgi:long-chain acyl-CoA synthetase